MKKIISICLISVFLILLSGCALVDKICSFSKDVEKSYDNAAEKTKELLDKINATKTKMDEMMNEIKTAQQQIDEAVKAVKEIVK